ncbi:hypothetical protein CDAR_91781 [Caerostris darwini]|uniref:Uncharacterized protein n=1 Tax=Caerostris darwini TaxID=1538125 RepID=A0AAV4QLK6_9ARAC|nr:hypothetical protein CDAR_91781 [Caerostris darwini]
MDSSIRVIVRRATHSSQRFASHGHFLHLSNGHFHQGRTFECGSGPNRTNLTVVGIFAVTFPSSICCHYYHFPRLLYVWVLCKCVISLPLMGARGSLFGIALKMDTNLIERFEMSFLHNVSQFM